MPGKDEEITARYLLPDLDPEITEDDIRATFEVFGELEQVTLKTTAGLNRTMGSLKFAAPTVEIRHEMLNGRHEVCGKPVKVQTWKMQKLQRGTGANAVKEDQGGKGPILPGGAFMGGAKGLGLGFGEYGGFMKGAMNAAAHGKGPYGKASVLSRAAAPAEAVSGESAPGTGEKDITARYLLVDMPEDIQEEEIRDYFVIFGELEEVTLKKLGNGSLVGSVKFAQPTVELRKIMLKEIHELPGREGQPLTVQTYKMQKEARPSYVPGPARGGKVQSAPKPSAQFEQPAKGKGCGFLGSGGCGGLYGAAGGGPYGAACGGPYGAGRGGPCSGACGGPSSGPCGGGFGGAKGACRGGACGGSPGTGCGGLYGGCGGVRSNPYVARPPCAGGCVGKGGCTNITGPYGKAGRGRVS